MDDKELDQLIDDTIKEAPTTLKPNIDSSWLQVKKRLHRKQKFQLRFRFVGVAVISFIIGATLFSTPAVVKAFSPLYQTVRELPNQIMAFFFGNQDSSETEPKTEPPKDTLSTPQDSAFSETDANIIEVSVEQLEEMLNFDVPKLNYLPLSYSLLRIEITEPGTKVKSNQVEFIYQNEEKQILRIFMQKLIENSTIGSGANRTGGTIKTIQLPAGEAYLTLTDDGLNKIELLQSDIYVHVMGRENEETLIQIVNNIIY